MLTVVGNELWTIDYDTFVKVDLATRSVKGVQVQPAGPSDSPSFSGMINEFAGELFFWSVRGKAVIPRPFSGDVAIVDPGSCTIEATIKLGGQPLCCVVTSNGRLVARDWKTGDWREASIAGTSRPWWRIW